MKCIRCTLTMIHASRKWNSFDDNGGDAQDGQTGDRPASSVICPSIAVFVIIISVAGQSFASVMFVAWVPLAIVFHGKMISMFNHQSREGNGDSQQNWSIKMNYSSLKMVIFSISVPLLKSIEQNTKPNLLDSKNEHYLLAWFCSSICCLFNWILLKGMGNNENGRNDWCDRVLLAELFKWILCSSVAKNQKESFTCWWWFFVDDVG